MSLQATALSEGAPPRVRHIGNRRLVSPLLALGASFEDRLHWLREETADQAQAAVCGAWPDALSRAPMHILCTTILSKMVCGWPEHADSLCQAVQQRTGLPLAGIVSGYQCTGWGFALRFAAAQTAAQRVLISIVDADLHDVMSQRYEDEIGGIGFGITTVAIDLDPAAALPCCDGPFANHGVTELLHAVRAQHKLHGPLPTFMPFLPDELARLSQRMIGQALAPNRHDHYGHTFGSDPWIGLAEWLQREKPAQPATVLLGAFAYDGYYTVGRMQAGPDTQVVLRPDLHPTAPSGHATA